MTWQEIRQRYPQRWLVLEGFEAYSAGGHWVVPRLEVIAVFADDWKPAWEHYKQLHHADRFRDYYVLHTAREELNIGVLDQFGRVVTE
ncbi:MAG: hypothetical protein MUE40_02345 [Anaerolineae bacterium]|jgi:hypothetical protein|nr:hypothetical protein [Anaerolineae bacterium]